MSEFQSYIARCRGGCGAIRFACSVKDDDPPSWKRTAAKDISKKIADGYRIESVSDDVVRDGQWVCTCPKAPPAQAGLFDAQEADTPPSRATRRGRNANAGES